jgi:FkbM family methyltransferase
MVFDRLKHLATAFRADAEFQRLGWRRGVFLLAYCGGWLRHHLSPRDTGIVKAFVVRHGVSGRSSTLHMRMRPGVGDWTVLRGVWLHHDYFHPLISRCQRILDVGANIGMTSVWFKGLNPEATLACVEPDPRNLPLLRLNLAENRIDARVFECAVATHTGRAQLGIEMNGGWSSLENAKLHAHTQFVEVETRRIPEILDDLGWTHVDLLKLDIEGLENDILADGGDWLSRVVLIVFELHPNNSEEHLTALLSRAGWSMERIGYLGDPTYLAKPPRARAASISLTSQKDRAV